MSDQSYETLLVEERDDRVIVTLHRPEARNAISGRMIDELHDVCARLEREPRLLLLTGHGRVFAGGADIAELLRRGRDEALQGINSRLFERVRRLPLPTVAAVDGWALGGGADAPSRGGERPAADGGACAAAAGGRGRGCPCGRRSRSRPVCRWVAGGG